MKHNRDIRVSPAFRVGERLFLIISRRSWTYWEGGIVGECLPVAMVAMDHDACSVWQLHDTITPEELKEALISKTGVPQ